MPSKVKNDKDIGFNTSIVPIIAIRKIYLYIIGKKAVNITVLKVQVKKASIFKTKVSKLKILQAKQQNAKFTTISTTIAFLGKNL